MSFFFQTQDRSFLSEQHKGQIKKVGTEFCGNIKKIKRKFRWQASVLICTFRLFLFFLPPPKGVKYKRKGTLTPYSQSFYFLRHPVHYESRAKLFFPTIKPKKN